jgi:hypothetical protein
MIDYINKRLNDWARWKVSERQMLRHMLGIRSCWPVVLKKEDDVDQKFERYGTVVPLDDLECCDTDKAVCGLPLDLRDAVLAYYTRTGTADSTAKFLGISKVTLFARIGRAHWHILGSLNDLAAGLRLAPEPTLPQKNLDSALNQSV